VEWLRRGPTMRRYVVLLAVAAALLVAASGCSATAVEEVPSGTEFVLSVGQSASVAGDDLQIQFVEVVSDSRCPQGATCFWMGEVSCLIELTTADSTYRKVLTQPGVSTPTEDSFGDYKITFDVQPYPEMGKPVDAKAYRLKLVISRTP
jgi:hypothetical protein